MKILFLVLATIFGTLPVKGLVPEGSLPIGSVEVAEEYAARMSDHYVSTFYQMKNGRMVTIARIWNGYFSYNSMGELLADFHVNLKQEAQATVLTTDPGVNKDEPIIYHTVFSSTNSPYWHLSTGRTNFTLVKTATGYEVPDLSWVRPGIGNGLAILIPTLKWARYEVRLADGGISSSSTQPILVVDSRFPSPIPDGLINIAYGIIAIPTKYVTSGLTGAWRIKVSTLTDNGDFEVWNSVGQKVAETPLYMKDFSVDRAHIYFTVTGGDPGRVLKVQKTSNFSTWEDCPNNYTVNLQPFEISLAKPVGNANSFRLVTVPIAP